MLDQQEYERWRAAAVDAVEAAGSQAARASHHWACFLAEQAAQLAMKGLLHGLGLGGWGHDLVELADRLSAALGEPLPEPVHDALLRLSRHYTATRYPDAHPAGTPGGHYGATDAAQATADAETVVGYVEETWAAAGRAAGEEAGGGG